MNKNYSIIKFQDNTVKINKPTETNSTLRVKEKAYFDYLDNTPAVLKVDKDHSIYSELINFNDIGDRTIITNKIADRAITTDKIADRAITTDKIADSAITTDKILDDAITTDKIANEVMLNNYSFNSQKINFHKIYFDNMTLIHESINNFILDSDIISVCNLNENQKTGNIINVFNNTSNYITIKSEKKMYNFFLLPPGGDYELSISPNGFYYFIFFDNKWVVKF